MIADWLVVLLDGMPIHIIESTLAVLVCVLAWRIRQGHALMNSSMGFAECMPRCPEPQRAMSATMVYDETSLPDKGDKTSASCHTSVPVPAPVEQYIDELFR